MENYMPDLDHDEVQVSPEQAAADDAAFEAAFNTARGVSSHGEGLTLQDDAQGNALITDPALGQDDIKDAQAQADADAQALVDAQAQAKAAADAEANAPATVTKAELDALRAVASQVTALQDELKRNSDTNNGRFGSLKQTLDAVKTQAQQGQKPSLKQLKRLEVDYPDLAKALSEDLEEAFGPSALTADPVADATNTNETLASGQAPGADVIVDPFADPRVQKVMQAKELTIVDAVHPGWRDIKATPEFSQWRNSLPETAKQLLGSTWDSTVLGAAFSDFKVWNSQRTATADANKQRDKRLAAGIPPTSGSPTGTNAIDDDAAFLGGFKTARGRG